MSEQKTNRFHSVHSKGITISEDGTIARRVNDYGFVFTSRPIQIGEKITIKLMEVSKRHLASAFCLGVTHKNPTETLFEDIRNYTYLDLVKEMGFFALPVDKKLCPRNTILTFVVTTNGQLVYEINGEEKGKLDKKIPTKTQMWGLIYFFENPVSIKLIKNLPLNVEKEKSKIIVDEKKIEAKGLASSSANEGGIRIKEEKRTSIFGVSLKPVIKNEENNQNEVEDCTICCEKEANAVLYKCAHMCLCYECAMDLWKGRGDGRCPLCRNFIEDVIKPYK